LGFVYEILSLHCIPPIAMITLIQKSIKGILNATYA
jgi:hypothetical protein